MASSDGLVFGVALDGSGGGREVGWPATDEVQEEGSVLWLHLDRDSERAHRWLATRSGIDPVVVEALLAEETRPRCQVFGDGVLLILRGVNLNPGADPEDMVSIRAWAEGDRVITTRKRRVMAVEDLRQRVRDGRGPRDAGDLAVQLAGRLVDRMGPVVDELDEDTSALEEELVVSQSRALRGRLRDVRRTAILLRRYLAPQREALARLHGEDPPWLDANDRVRLREVTDRVLRYVEDLDEVRERAAVIQDELMNRLSEQMNRNMYVLSVVASIMLPLGFLTGLLGINVGGIPGAENPAGFAVVCSILGVLVVAQVVVFRRLRLL